MSVQNPCGKCPGLAGAGKSLSARKKNAAKAPKRYIFIGRDCPEIWRVKYQNAPSQTKSGIAGPLPPMREAIG